MALQNRVDPFGRIHAVAARGMFTGNRGIIHDPATRTLLKKRWASKAWIICACAYKERPPRDVMGYNRPGSQPPKAGWTELFFLDEVTALAAGHRPCFECRREAAKAFAARFGEANGLDDPKVAAIDAILHRQRLASSRREGPTLTAEELADLPDGAMVSEGGRAFALRGGTALRWSFDGYGAPVELRTLTAPHLVTPPATVAALRAGFMPVCHGSAHT